MFTATRLSLARKRRGLTKKGLAEAIGVTPHTVLRYESEEIVPSDDVVQKIAETLTFPVEFFSGDEVDEIDETAASFRSMAAMTARQRDAALAAGSLAFMLSDYVEREFDLPNSQLDSLADERPEIAARALRQTWNLGEKPIKNMVHLLEAKGVRVFALAEQTKNVDAFSLWRRDRPYVFLNMMKTPERSRFDAAHELGHLVLHKHGGPRGRKAEEEADTFASSFLMPSADVKAIAPRVFTLNQIIELKRRWGVSMLAMTYRLHKLGAITDWQYRMFCIQASERGRDKEPNGMDREQSSVWQKVLTALWTERKTKSHIAADLFMPQQEIENLLFGLANLQGSPPAERPTSGPQLTLIQNDT
jgi:Zn-dependent peptidase ImmA (M78 family)/DNA-binding XRE family transcriptional regulator